MVSFSYQATAAADFFGKMLANLRPHPMLRSRQGNKSGNMTYLFFVLGLVALFFGGEFLVRGASAIARAFRLSPMVIGLTVVGFGTSAPELLVSVQAALAGQPAIAIGNVLGSNVSNILLILGVAAAMAPLAITPSRLWRDFAFILAATALVWWMLSGGIVSRLDGVLLLAGLVAFIGTALLTGKSEPLFEPHPMPQWQAWGLTLAGLVLLVIGAHYLVDSATKIARAFGLSEAVIGLTIVAVGTSLPELATSIIATIRRQTDIAVGNVVGSNIFNLFGILGTTAVITPIPADPRFSSHDMLWVAGASVALVALSFALKGLPRLAGAGLLAGYAAFVLLMA